MNFTITNYFSNLESNSSLLIELDGSLVKTLKKFYKLIGEKLHINEYFGENLDAFDEIINDLSWLEEPELYIYIKNFEDFLSKEDIENKELIFSLLDEAADNQKITPEGTPIHIILENKGNIEEFLNEIGVQYIKNANNLEK